MALDVAFGVACFGFLLLATLPQPYLGSAAKLLWIASFGGLALVNVGAALGAYIAAAAVFANPLVAEQAGGGLLARPDNIGLLALVYALVVLRRGGRPIGWLEVLPAALVVYGVAQGVLLGTMQLWIFGWYLRMFGIPFALAALMCRAGLSVRELRGLIVSLVAFGCYDALVSIGELAGMEAILLPPWINDTALNPALDSGRSGGVFLQSEWNGLALGLILGLLMAPKALVLRSGPMREIGWLICGLALVATLTRGALLGLLVGVLIMLTFGLKSGVEATRRRLFAIMAIIVLMAGTMLLPKTAMDSRLGDTDTVYYRLNLWLTGLRIVAAHPVLGIGFAQFGKTAVDYHEQSDALEFTNLSSDSSDVIHNTVLGVAVELGLLGLALYLVTAGLLCFHAVRRASAAFGRGAGTWVASVAAIYAVNVQFVVAHDLPTNVLFYGVIGAIAGLQLPLRPSLPTGIGAGATSCAV